MTVMDLPAFLGASYHLWVVIKLGKIHHELPQKGAVLHGIPFPGSAPVLHVSGIKGEMEQLDLPMAACDLHELFCTDWCAHDITHKLLRSLWVRRSRPRCRHILMSSVSRSPDPRLVNLGIPVVSP